MGHLNRRYLYDIIAATVCSQAKLLRNLYRKSAPGGRTKTAAMVADALEATDASLYSLVNVLPTEEQDNSSNDSIT